jgi:uncharacterized protein
MSHPSTKQYSYSTQLGFLIAFLCAGFIIGTIASLIPLLGKISLADLQSGSSDKIMDKLLAPENTSRMMWVQFISTFFLFFLPAVFYALICHKKPFTHLGFAHTVNIKEIIIVVAIITACLPLVDVLSELTLKLPFPKAVLKHFQDVEDNYDKQVGAFTQMKTFGDYILSLIVIAFLPALFEETLFRGGIQNLLTRWTKIPVLAITITAILFSAAHFSYIGFLSRVALGFILGWIYYRTGNIWLNIIGHFTNNAIAVTSIYVSAKTSAAAVTNTDPYIPLWTGLVSLVVVYLLFIVFENFCKKDIDHPGEEVLIPGYNYYNPFETEQKGNLN